MAKRYLLWIGPWKMNSPLVPLPSIGVHWWWHSSVTRINEDSTHSDYRFSDNSFSSAINRPIWGSSANKKCWVVRSRNPFRSGYRWRSKIIYLKFYSLSNGFLLHQICLNIVQYLYMQSNLSNQKRQRLWLVSQNLNHYVICHTSFMVLMLKMIKILLVEIGFCISWGNRLPNADTQLIARFLFVNKIHQEIYHKKTITAWNGFCG